MLILQKLKRLSHKNAIKSILFHENLIENRTKGVILRSKCDWYENGEKSTRLCALRQLPFSFPSHLPDRCQACHWCNLHCTGFNFSHWQPLQTLHTEENMVNPQYPGTNDYYIILSFSYQ